MRPGLSLLALPTAGCLWAPVQPQHRRGPTNLPWWPLCWAAGSSPWGPSLPCQTQALGPEGGVWGGGRVPYSATCHCREGLQSSENEGEESWRPWGGGMSGDLVGRATFAFLILRREDPQKVPESRGRKSGESQASWVGGGGLESRVSQGCMHPRARPWIEAGEQVVSGGHIALAWELHPESSFPSGGQSPQPPRTPVFNGSMNSWQTWGLESLRETSAMGRRGQRLCCGVYSKDRVPGS